MQLASLQSHPKPKASDVKIVMKADYSPEIRAPPFDPDYFVNLDVKVIRAS
jgi:hypothetical protein